MSESAEIAQRLDAIYDTELTNRLVSSLSSPSYTLAELRELSKEYLATSQLTDTLAPELILSSLLAWLAKKEREANERNETESA